MNTYRKMLVNAIRDNGGYGKYALSWNVSTYKADVDFDDCFNRCFEENENFKNIDKDDFEEFCDWGDMSYYDWSIESMQRGLLDGDDCYRSYRPEIAKIYGMPYYTPYCKTYTPFNKYIKRPYNIYAYYPAKKDGWILNGHFNAMTFNVEFGLEGRQGKHLVIRSFEGINLDLYSDNLADEIENDDCGNYPNEWCKHLLVMIKEWDLMFTTQNAANELEYNMDYYMVEKLNEYL